MLEISWAVLIMFRFNRSERGIMFRYQSLFEGSEQFG